MNNKLNCILLVDDDKATNFLNRRLLNKMEIAHEIQVSKNGVEAEEYLLKSAAQLPGYTKPSLIFLDINMPLVNGWEFLDRYRLLPDDFKKSIQIWMLTTSLQEVDLVRTQDISFVSGLVYKPLTAESVTKVLASLRP